MEVEDNAPVPQPATTGAPLSPPEPATATRGGCRASRSYPDRPVTQPHRRRLEDPRRAVTSLLEPRQGRRGRAGPPTALGEVSEPPSAVRHHSHDHERAHAGRCVRPVALFGLDPIPGVGGRDRLRVTFDVRLRSGRAQQTPFRIPVSNGSRVLTCARSPRLFPSQADRGETSSARVSRNGLLGSGDDSRARRRPRRHLVRADHPPTGTAKNSWAPAHRGHHQPRPARRARLQRGLRRAPWLGNA